MVDVDAMRSSVSVVGGVHDDDGNKLMETRIRTYEKNKSQKQTLASCSLLESGSASPNKSTHPVTR